MPKSTMEVIKRGKLAPDFRRRISLLGELKKKITTANRLLAKAYIQYASDFSALLDEATGLDKRLKTSSHTDALASLGGLDGTQLNKSTISKWRKIARYSSTLTAHESHLPASRDSLYEVACAVEKRKNLVSLIKTNALSPTSTYAECRKLHSPTTGSAKSGQKTERLSTAQAKQLISRYSKEAVSVNAPLNSFARHNKEKEMLTNGLALALVTTELDADSGTERLVILKTINDEALLAKALDLVS